MDQRLKGRRIAALAADGFEKVELVIPMRALQAAGASVDVISLRHGFVHALKLFGIFVGLTVAVNAPFALAAPENWQWFFKYNQIREIEPSLYLLAGVDPRGFVTPANQISEASWPVTSPIWF